MRRNVVISYTSSVKDVVHCVATALRMDGCEVFFYSDDLHQGWINAQSWASNFRRQTEKADIFMQIIGNDLGSPMTLDDGTTALAMPAELKICQAVQATQKGYPAFLGLRMLPNGVNSSDAIDDYFKELGANGPKFITASTGYRIIDHALTFVRREAVAEKSYMEGVLVPGCECSSIVSELMDCVTGEDLFPQKYLYTTLRGACLWQWLASPKSGSSIANVYSQCRFRNAENKVFAAMAESIKKSMKDNPSGAEKVLGVLVLGCGDGKREAQLCQRLLYDRIVDRLRVVLIDVSSELVEVASRAFRDWGESGCEVDFAVVNFENSSALEKVRQTYLSGLPVLALLLGNTLGNMDEAQLLSEIVGALNPVCLLAEILMCEISDAAAKEVVEQPISKEDKRYEFITTPLILLGERPIRQNLTTRVARDGNKIIQTFRYHFWGIEKEIVVEDVTSQKKVRLKNSSWVDLLQIKAVTKNYLEKIGKAAGLSNIVVEEEEYKLKPEAGVVKMGYLIGKA